MYDMETSTRDLKDFEVSKQIQSPTSRILFNNESQASLDLHKESHKSLRSNFADEEVETVRSIGGQQSTKNDVYTLKSNQSAQSLQNRQTESYKTLVRDESLKSNMSEVMDSPIRHKIIDHPELPLIPECDFEASDPNLQNKALDLKKKEIRKDSDQLAGTLIVKPKNAQLVKDMAPFLRMSIDKASTKETKSCQDKGKTPSWDDVLTFDIKTGKELLFVEVY